MNMVLKHLLTCLIGAGLSAAAFPSDLGYRSPSPDWLACKWAKKDPLSGVTAKVEAEYKHATNKRAFVKSIGAQSGTSSKSIVRYLLASYRLRKDDPDYSLYDAYRATTLLHEPSSREAARARFLISSGYDSTEGLCTVGERLLARNEDFDVRYELVKIRVNAIFGDRSRYNKGVAAAKQLLTRYPKEPKAHAAMAVAYLFGYRQLGIVGDRLKALDEYRLFLASKPPECSYVKRVRKLVQELANQGGKRD